MGGRKGREGRRCSDGGGERRVRRERDNAGVPGQTRAAAARALGASCKTSRGYAKKEQVSNFLFFISE